MNITVLKSKIHRGVVTDSKIDYIGSIEIDTELMEKSGIIENEQVHVVNLSNGERWVTYALPAKAGTKTISVNGGGARLALAGDLLVIMAYGLIEIGSKLEPRIVIMNEEGEIT